MEDPLKNRIKGNLKIATENWTERERIKNTLR